MISTDLKYKDSLDKLEFIKKTLNLKEDYKLIYMIYYYNSKDMIIALFWNITDLQDPVNSIEIISAIKNKKGDYSKIYK